MADGKKTRREETALFRFERIAGLVRLEPGSETFRRVLRARAAEECSVPGTARRRVSAATLRRWTRLYRRDGLEALIPKRRRDRGRRWALSAEVTDRLAAIKERAPGLSVRLVIRQALREGWVPAATRLAPATVHRLLSERGLMRREAVAEGARDQRRFACAAAGDLWQADVMHGPKVRAAGDGRRRKSYLVNFLLCTRTHKRN